MVPQGSAWPGSQPGGQRVKQYTWINAATSPKSAAVLSFRLNGRTIPSAVDMPGYCLLCYPIPIRHRNTVVNCYCMSLIKRSYNTRLRAVTTAISLLAVTTMGCFPARPESATVSCSCSTAICLLSSARASRRLINQYNKQSS
ncbi:hypothetical protein D3C79_485260 [compost metagenome]